MRTSEELRAHLLERLTRALAHPAMYTHEPDLYFSQLLEDLAFIDGREWELSELRVLHVEGRGLWTATGTRGAFARWFSETASLSVEFASVWAELAFHAGYLAIEHRLAAEQWQETTRAVTLTAREQDVTEAEVQRGFGKFSFTTGGAGAVRAYVSDRGEWLFLDFDGRSANGRGYLNDGSARLRNIRTPTPRFELGLVFTPWGQRFARRA
jgi:hypothetical protein